MSDVLTELAESPPVDPHQATIREFHRFWYDAEIWKHQVFWRGISCYKCPFDLWQYQQIIHRVRPAAIIELGTARGGSALFLADMLRLEGLPGHVYTIDLEPWANTGPQAPNLTYLAGRKSTDPELFAELWQRLAVGPAGPVLVIADSDHRAANVLAELRLYSPLVTVGSYFIVEDTNLNGHPVFPTWGDGPHEAVEEFLAEHPEFVRDSGCEAFQLTWNPGGYLCRLPD